MFSLEFKFFWWARHQSPLPTIWQCVNNSLSQSKDAPKTNIFPYRTKRRRRSILKPNDIYALRKSSPSFSYFFRRIIFIFIADDVLSNRRWKDRIREFRMSQRFRLRKRDDYFWVTLEASGIFWASWGSRKNWLEPQTKALLQILTKLSLSKSMIRTIEKIIDEIIVKC